MKTIVSVCVKTSWNNDANKNLDLRTHKPGRNQRKSTKKTKKKTPIMEARDGSAGKRRKYSFFQASTLPTASSSKRPPSISARREEESQFQDELPAEEDPKLRDDDDLRASDTDGDEAAGQGF